MPKTLRRGDSGPEVQRLQGLLAERGYGVTISGVFDAETQRAVRAFQSANLDPNGQPLLVDGVVGPRTWWSLTHGTPSVAPRAPVDYSSLPPPEMGGTSRGRAALEAAIAELRAGAGEIGGNNRGPFVRKYLNGLAPEGSSWCAAFVSWCYAQGPGGCPFTYTVSARALLADLKRRGWAHLPGSGFQPQPGDIVVWWREKLAGWKGHAGLVHQFRDGILYTIEGNRSRKVQGFSYVFSRMEKLLGFGRVPDE
ncbi:MAG: peptidoglycan-binding protein [Bryobacterales bacterium]|nr:peptidoglycan-binding protein [Bryobacterales bacterium]